MISQICHNFQASQGVHGADDVKNLSFQSQVNSMSTSGPQVDNPYWLQQEPDYINLGSGHVFF